MVGETFVAWLGQPPGLSWLDVGCGAGALSSAILHSSGTAHVTGIDPSRKDIEIACGAVGSPSADFLEGAAETLPFADHTFDVVVSGLALNFMHDVHAAMHEMSRVVVAGGLVAGYVWDFSGGMDVMRKFWDAAIKIDPEARAFDQGPRFPLCRPQPLYQLFVKHGLESTEVIPIDVDAIFPSFDIYWDAMITGEGSTPDYVASLSESTREAVRRRLRDSLLENQDGSVQLKARAWAARGLAQSFSHSVE